MGPGLKFLDNLHFLIYLLLVAIPIIIIWGIWRTRRATIVGLAVIPSVILIAHVACTIEENMFIEEHKSLGTGPTSRHKN